MSLVYLKNKKNGVTYVYECESFWNKEKKRPDSKRKCIGKLDSKTGDLIPSARMQDINLAKTHLETIIADIKIKGSTLLFDHISEITGLKSVLKSSFPKNWRMILSLAYFQVKEGKPISEAEHWSKTHIHPYGKFIDSCFYKRAATNCN